VERGGRRRRGTVRANGVGVKGDGEEEQGQQLPGGALSSATGKGRRERELLLAGGAAR